MRAREEGDIVGGGRGEGRECGAGEQRKAARSAGSAVGVGVMVSAMRTIGRGRREMLLFIFFLMGCEGEQAGLIRRPRRRVRTDGCPHHIIIDRF
jgi:hypothetical protein